MCWIRSKNRTPLSVWLMSIVFCVWNGFLQVWVPVGQVLLGGAGALPSLRPSSAPPCSSLQEVDLNALHASHTQGHFLAFQLPPSEPITPLVALGAAVQLCGLASTIACDWTLTHLRKPGETGEGGIRPSFVWCCW